VIRVCEERERQVVFGGEFRLALLVEDADAEDRGFLGFELRQVVLE
jgi:hypothetical protein